MNYNDGSDFEKYMHSGNKVPVFCCKENPLTEPYRASNDACQKNQEWDLQHNSVSNHLSFCVTDSFSLLVYMYNVFCMLANANNVFSVSMFNIH